MIRKFIAIILGVALLTILNPFPVGAWTASNLQWLGIDGDNWYNYDFRNWNLQASDVDWPVTQIYYGNANTNAVKTILWGEASLDSDMRMLIQDDSTYTYDQDKGSKQGVPAGWHVRTYASYGASSWCPTFGSYVIATTHYDAPPVWGWSEDSAYYIAEEAALTIGWGNISLDSVWMYNYENSRWEGVNYIQSDGYADLLYIP